MPTINPSKLDIFRAYRPLEPAAKRISEEQRRAPIDNGVSRITFFDTDPLGKTRPYLKAVPSPTEDPLRLDKVIEATPEKLEELKGDAGKMEAFLKEAATARNDYLRPTKESLGVKTEYKLNHIVGLRVDQFAAEARRLVAELYPTGPERNRALRAANVAIDDLYLDREIQFDNFRASGYASFGHDAAFIHVYETHLKALSALNPELLSPAERARVERQKQQIQGELDYIFRNKYVLHSSNMQETDAETSMGLVAIDRRTRQRVSEKPASRDGIVPDFEVLNAVIDGERKAIYFDVAREKYFLDGTSTEVHPNESTIERQSVSSNEVTFRRAANGEALRSGFRFDWNQDGYVQTGAIDWVGWAGHCNDKAALEGAGVVIPQDNPGVTEYASASGRYVVYDRDLLNEALFSLSELGSEMSDLRGGEPVADIGRTEFAAARDDDRPDQIVLGGRRIPLNDHPNELTIESIVIGDEEMPAEEAFAEYKLAADGMSAERNPLFSSITEGDVVQLATQDAKIKAHAKIQVFDEDTGYLRFDERDLVLDFKAPPEEPILVDTAMSNASRREYYEITLDLKSHTWNYQLFRMEKAPGAAKFEKVEVPGASGSEPFDPGEVMARHETSLDNPRTWLPFVEDAMKTGVNGTAETADGAGVWNGKMHMISKSREQVQGDWERVSVSVSAEYGGNQGRYLMKRGETGTPEIFVPIELPADFFWRQAIVFAPQDGRLVNTKALQRGFVTVDGGAVHADALSDMLELLHLAFSDKHYSILHEGERFVFDTKEDFDAEVARVEALRSELIEGGEPNTALHLERSGVVEQHRQVDLEPVPIEEDTMVHVELVEGERCSLGIAVKTADNQERSHEMLSFSSRRSVDIPAEGGTSVHIAVLGPWGEDLGATPFRIRVDTNPMRIPDTRPRHS